MGPKSARRLVASVFLKKVPQKGWGCMAKDFCNLLPKLLIIKSREGKLFAFLVFFERLTKDSISNFVTRLHGVVFQGFNRRNRT